LFFPPLCVSLTLSFQAGRNTAKAKIAAAMLPGAQQKSQVAKKSAGGLFDDDDDDIFGDGSKPAPAKVVAKAGAAGSLFDDDDDDLFGGKPAVAAPSVIRL